MSDLRPINSWRTLVFSAGLIALACCFNPALHARQNGADEKQESKTEGSTAKAAQQESALRGNAQAARPNSDAKTDPTKRIWRVGASIRGGGRPATNIKLTFPIPTDWPEQHVNLYKENIPTEARSAELRMSEGIQQMVVIIPKVERGVQIDVNVLMEITIKAIAYPDRTDNLVIPKRPPREMRLHLTPSPLIESRQRIVRNKLKELVKKDVAAWEQIRGFYEFVTSEVAMDEKSEVLGAKVALKELKGAIEDRTNVFIALCRAHKVPARTVWADDGEYAEFYLQDETGEGKWYPVVLDKKHEFGKMSNPRVVIQKGDNIKVPESNQRQRFVVEDISGNVSAGAKPNVRFIRDLLPSRDAK